ncbi:MAG: YHS domain-containing protein [Deltaproteobacteria bacterium]|nr:YHS domain-containing protein [Deltaproteobacteria bacterium]
MKKRHLVVFAILAAFLAVNFAAAAGSAGKGNPQTACPVMAGNIDKNLFIDYQGQRVYFCCPGCVDVFKKDPEKYLQKMKEAGIEPEKAPAAR